MAAAELITLRGPADDFAVRRAAALLRDGAVGVVPTDTVYGLVALATREAAVRRVLDIKGRPAGKPLPVLVSGLAGAAELSDTGAGVYALPLMERFWPGPLTLVLPRRPGIELPFQPPESIGLRAPDSAFCLALLECAGPLVAPSANYAGEGAPAALDEVDEGLLELVDFAVDGGRCPAGEQSTVLSLLDAPELLRQGAVAAADLFAVLDALAGGGD